MGRFWQPFARTSLQPDGLTLTPDGQLLADAARLTGGAFHVTQLINEPTLAGTFRRAFDDFRNSYVLQYTPRGVRRQGWHEIAVTVPGLPASDIRARRGYAVEAPASDANRERASPDSRRLESLITAYEKGDFAAVGTGLAATPDAAGLIRDFREAVNPWPAHLSTRNRNVPVLSEIEMSPFVLRSKRRNSEYGLWALWKTRSVGFPRSGVSRSVRPRLRQGP
jgi:hypothetical protein